VAVRKRRKALAVEVIQTSAMDCGPACLKSFLEGFGVRASYGRLREACQTDVDGTSIDALEDRPFGWVWRRSNECSRPTTCSFRRAARYPQSWSCCGEIE